MGRKIQYRSFEDAREFARALNLRNKEEWTRYAKGELANKPAKPQDIPSRVDKIFRGKGWCGFDDFLGTKRTREIEHNFKPFEQARAWCRKLNLNNHQDWQSYVRGDRTELAQLPEDIPSNPEEIYSDQGWVSWPDFLNDRYTPMVVSSRCYEEAREYVRSLGLQSIQEWERFRNGQMRAKGTCPEDIPVWPPHAYKSSGWTNWSDWLGLTIARRSII